MLWRLQFASRCWASVIALPRSLRWSTTMRIDVDGCTTVRGVASEGERQEVSDR